MDTPVEPAGQAGRSRWRRKLALDAPLGLVAGALTLLGAHWHAARSNGWDPGPPGAQGPPGPPWGAAGDVGLPPSAYACAVVIVGCVAVRRIWPRGAFAVAALAIAVFVGTGNGYGPVLLGPALLVFAMAAAFPPRSWVPWTALMLPLVVVLGLDRPYLGLVDTDTAARLVLVLAVVAVPAALGVIARTYRENARRERERALAESAHQERLRIAREVHDVVGHSLSVINMQAGAALHVLGSRPDQVESSLTAIRQTSKDALDELRGTLAVFRDPRAARGANREPLPGLADLDELVDSSSGAGGRVASVRTVGEPVTLPAAVDHAAYRIVQEALTNVVRHAGGADAAVRITYRPREVVVEVTDEGPARPQDEPAAGGGTAGMRERAAAVGGSLSVGPRSGGGYAVRAVLPLDTPSERP
ncbi:sensor histidine kinase [Haloactinospora alba]|uniref:sensor histidine kinase n=1 Tax=Haloactinospora alba TaxID=405555 RepID=UPI001FE4240D|nr:sensor histidine kinase [Haloactinospora alba]